MREIRYRRECTVINYFFTGSKIHVRKGHLSGTTMSDLFREILADATSLSHLAEKTTHPPVRLTILEAARKALDHAIELLPAEVQKKKYILPKKVVTSRAEFTPWSSPLKKVDHNAFKRDILSFLRGAYKGRTPAENLKEMHKLWEMFKHLPTVEESISCAIQEIKAVTEDA